MSYHSVEVPEELIDALRGLKAVTRLPMTELVAEGILLLLDSHGRPLADFPSLESRRAARVEALRRASAARWRRDPQP